MFRPKFRMTQIKMWWILLLMSHDPLGNGVVKFS